MIKKAPPVDDEFDYMTRKQRRAFDEAQLVKLAAEQAKEEALLQKRRAQLSEKSIATAHKISNSVTERASGSGRTRERDTKSGGRDPLDAPVDKAAGDMNRWVNQKFRGKHKAGLDEDDEAQQVLFNGENTAAC